ncbi:MAG: phosphoribosylpyrophosphate synthetase, partial [Bacteriovoracaceae bacterium]|nr:phosphoribosylpyrophosphate synthetase [Bacteriovoracaceae bacterium]
TAGTLMEAIKVLAKEGAQQIHVCATHPIFSPPALERIKNCKELSSIIVTDTVALGPEVAEVGKIKVLPTHRIFAKAIELTYKHDSINALFL